MPRNSKRGREEEEAEGGRRDEDEGEEASARCTEEEEVKGLSALSLSAIISMAESACGR